MQPPCRRVSNKALCHEREVRTDWKTWLSFNLRVNKGSPEKSWRVRHAIKRPVSAAATGSGNSSVFGTPFCVPDSHTFSRNPGLGPRERTKRAEIGGRIRTIFGTQINAVTQLSGYANCKLLFSRGPI
jgi:hypothetical protein